jgi:hypothetical protein
MGEVKVTITLKDQGPEKGWKYTHWHLDVGKGQGPRREDVQVYCAESSQRALSKDEAAEEAKSRVRVQIDKECGRGQPICMSPAEKSPPW